MVRVCLVDTAVVVDLEGGAQAVGSVVLVGWQAWVGRPGKVVEAPEAGSVVVSSEAAAAAARVERPHRCARYSESRGRPPLSFCPHGE